MIKTPITYYGGKQNLAKMIVALIPEHTIYTEAFAGGAAVFFLKSKVKNEIINDTDNFVTIFYKVLHEDFEALKSKIKVTAYSRVVYNVALNIYKHNVFFTDLQRAWAFFVLTNMGFSGRIGSFGCYTKGTKAMGWENKKEMLTPELKDRLKGTQIECTDALKILTLRDSPETFHYIDPPYFNSNMGHYSNYSKDDFIELLKVLSKLKGKFILSSYPSELLTQFTLEFNWHTKTVEQLVTANQTKSKTNKTKTEVLTANFPLD
ncbi:DNA adenine methylase [Olleya sp. UBA1516]|uniref:DNA adenine methylase n=1 Tax=Olleya sp. UBA1516 TaxID=1947013 RepID=UPI0025FC2735|nr:DNA adenine methylase [Olleya sp. UBA1516]|tara:strand:+ start:125201 stop:125989 length:789 start_codon:yes stop_codon:yes gene_type:complete